MTRFTICVAGCNIEVGAIYESTKTFCWEYLSGNEADFSVEITPEDIAFEREKADREDMIEGLPLRNFPDYLLEQTAVQRKIANRLIERDILLLHGSVVAVDGNGYLFTAKSGTGKSTHTRLWREVFGDRAVMINDDKPFLRIADDGVTVYGTPWNGKHRLGSNTSVPLRGICILTRGEDDRIGQIPASDALVMLMQQSYRPDKAVLLPKYLELIDALTKKMSFYRMECTMDPRAAQVSFDAMSGNLKG